MSTTTTSYERISTQYEPSAKGIVDVYSQKSFASENNGDPRCVKSTVELPVHLPPSPADSDKMDTSRPSTSPSPIIIEGQRITRDISRGTPGDITKSSMSKSPEQKQLAKKRSQYYGDAFAYREPTGSARDRVSRDSMVLCELVTNVIMREEHTLLTSLSNILSTRYQRPESSIFVTLKHSACFIVAGTFEPAYIMTITALPSQMQPVTNKRNASLLQNYMATTELYVEPERGIIKFVPLAEENFATNGKTVAGEIEELERETANDGSGHRSLHTPGTVKSKKRMSTKSTKSLKSKNLQTHEEYTPSVSSRESPPLPPMPVEVNALDKKAMNVQKLGRRKSFMAAVFGNKSKS
ncbi:d426359d-1ff6-40fa-a4b8-896aefd4fcba [Sclerotinia trifoliorum]|uniref:L-dopachrome isomerase n=1 Tax=Sclerotinia trifoliorum TaxID=28548 RepID=A0A8H2ZT10_9HELO|nr:d426359d-1ff6-40fa-a4b8-896aefd4fcba [Sclerotinia trifoliorum]